MYSSGVMLLEGIMRCPILHPLDARVLAAFGESHVIFKRLNFGIFLTDFTLSSLKRLRAVVSSW